MPRFVAGKGQEKGKGGMCALVPSPADASNEPDNSGTRERVVASVDDVKLPLPKRGETS
jgi:hypothetical protein